MTLPSLEAHLVTLHLASQHRNNWQWWHLPSIVKVMWSSGTQTLRNTVLSCILFLVLYSKTWSIKEEHPPEYNITLVRLEIMNQRSKSFFYSSNQSVVKPGQTISFEMLLLNIIWLLKHQYMTLHIIFLVYLYKEIILHNTHYWQLLSVTASLVYFLATLQLFSTSPSLVFTLDTTHLTWGAEQIPTFKSTSHFLFLDYWASPGAYHFCEDWARDKEPYRKKVATAEIATLGGERSDFSKTGWNKPHIDCSLTA